MSLKNNNVEKLFYTLNFKTVFNNLNVNNNLQFECLKIILQVDC